jgi:hypothetical protein
MKDAKNPDETEARSRGQSRPSGPDRQEQYQRTRGQATSGEEEQARDARIRRRAYKTSCSRPVHNGRSPTPTPCPTLKAPNGRCLGCQRGDAPAPRAEVRSAPAAVPRQGDLEAHAADQVVHQQGAARPTAFDAWGVTKLLQWVPELLPVNEGYRRLGSGIHGRPTRQLRRRIFDRG